MKLILIIAAGALLAGMIGWAAYDTDGFRHSLWGYSQAEQKKAWAEYQTTVARSNQRLDAELLESSTRVVTLRHGEAAGSKYRKCHSEPPTTKAHKAECERLDKQKAREDAQFEAEQKKHPW